MTILVDKYTGQPKGFAYVEFELEACVKNAVLLNDTLFRGRQLKVMAKRTNLPGMKAGFRGRGRPHGPPGFNPRYGGKPPGFAKPRGFRPY